MLRLLLKHKLLYIVTLTVAVFITASIYFYIDSQVRDDTVTVGFVDASAATIGSYDLISQAFAPEAIAAEPPPPDEPPPDEPPDRREPDRRERRYERDQ